MLDYYEDLVARAMGRLLYTPEIAYAADVNDLICGLCQQDDSRRELLEALFGPAEPPKPGAADEPAEHHPKLTPERFDAAFSSTVH